MHVHIHGAMATGIGDQIGADECSNTCCKLVSVAGDVQRLANIQRTFRRTSQATNGAHERPRILTAARTKAKANCTCQSPQDWLSRWRFTARLNAGKVSACTCMMGETAIEMRGYGCGEQVAHDSRDEPDADMIRSGPERRKRIDDGDPACAELGRGTVRDNSAPVRVVEIDRDVEVRWAT